MATAVASRFAVLSLDVEDDSGRARKVDKKKTPPDAAKEKDKASSSKSRGASQTKQQDAKKKTNKKKPENTAPTSSKKGNGGNSSQKKPKLPANGAQWEEWKKKDQEFVSESYEHDLQEAVLQSKLEFDELCKLRKAQGLDDNLEEKGSKKKGKQQKAQTMSLDQFNKMKEDSNKKVDPKKEISEEDSRFFERINEFAAIALDQELKTENCKARQAQPETRVHVTLAQFQDDLTNRDKEIALLKETVEKLEMELANVKERNTKLCAILAHGEMKDKVDVLLEVERLKTGREELLAEVQNLHAQLEQERSKVHGLTKSSEKQKSKSKK